MQHTKQPMPDNIRVVTVKEARKPHTTSTFTITMDRTASEGSVADRCRPLHNIHVQGRYCRSHTKKQRSSEIQKRRKARGPVKCDDRAKLLQLNIIELKKMSKSGLQANLSILKNTILIESDLGLFDV